MPPRRAARSSSGTHQSVLSFKTPSKIVKNTNPHTGLKKDIASTDSKKRTATSSPPVDEVTPPTTTPNPALAPITQRKEPVSKEVLAEYYKTHILGTRRSQPMHQEGMSLQDKVLRHWDMSTQYGPCIGISRLERWMRADRLGLEPPVVVRLVCEGFESGEKSWLEEALSLRGLCRL